MKRDVIFTRNKKREWLGAFVYAALFFLFFWIYHEWRGKPLSLFTANKSIAIAAVFTIGTCLGLGVLSRLFDLPAKLLRWRRPLGVTGALLTLPHALISLFFLPEKFPVSYYVEHWASLILGFAALVGLLYLAWISRASSLKNLGRNVWKYRQSTGWYFLAAALLHFTVLGKLDNWIKWIFNPEGWPPGTLTPFLFGATVLLFRLFLGFRKPSNPG